MDRIDKLEQLYRECKNLVNDYYNGGNPLSYDIEAIEKLIFDIEDIDINTIVPVNGEENNHD